MSAMQNESKENNMKKRCRVPLPALPLISPGQNCISPLQLPLSHPSMNGLWNTVNDEIQSHNEREFRIMFGNDYDQPTEDRAPCLFPYCKSLAVKRGYCIFHGGGDRCQYFGCLNSAVPSENGEGIIEKLYCLRHGGGRHCVVKGCSSGSRQGSTFCVKHGGGQRCEVYDCKNGAQIPFSYCKQHGGVRRCLVHKCEEEVIGAHLLCRYHAAENLRDLNLCEKDRQSAAEKAQTIYVRKRRKVQMQNIGMMPYFLPGIPHDKMDTIMQNSHEFPDQKRMRVDEAAGLDAEVDLQTF